MNMTILIAFVVGFLIGVFERKIDRLKVSKQTLLNLVRKEPKSEVLVTPPEEELKKAEDKEFYEKIV